MYLGLSNSKDSGVALVSEGSLVYAANEERFSRCKLTNEVPRLALQDLSRHCQISLEEVEEICIGTWKGIDSPKGFQRYLEFIKEQSDVSDEKISSAAFFRLKASIMSDYRQKEDLEKFLKGNELDKKRIVYYSHHQAHAAGAFLYSGFDNALAITMDGRGDFTSTVSVWKNGEKPHLLKLFPDL